MNTMNLQNSLGEIMENYNAALLKNAGKSATWLLMFLVGSAVAAPAIQGAAGTFDHKGNVTINGSGFGTKATAAPVIWDDASGSSILNKWSAAWPNNNPTYNLAYRSPMRGIALPHNHITKYIAGAHGTNVGANGGYNVIMFKYRTISFPSYTYASWYQRSDDAWTFCGDNNYKTFAYSTGTSPYNMPKNWYLEYNPRPTSRTSGASWHMNDDSLNLTYQSLTNSSSWWGSSAVNPMAGQWSKIELEIKYTNQSDGFIKIKENGVTRLSYAGSTDKYDGTARTEGIGGYSRCYGYSTNWRYFADAYLDYSLARVVLANNSSLSQATIIEPQIPTSWGSSSINVTVNLGKFSQGQTAYLFVVDSSGIANSTGLPVTVGGTSTTPPAPTSLTPPTNLRTL